MASGLGAPFAAVLFDLDGTLLDTETVSSQAVQRAIGRFGAKVSAVPHPSRSLAAFLAHPVRCVL